IQLANNEIGSIQDIAALARVAHEAGILFHTDAVQALGKIPLDLSALGVDAASFSAHKLSGPKGCGALYLKAKIPFESLLVGGGQEEGRRSGTQNVCGAVGFAAALKAALVRQTQELPRLTKMRDGLYAALTALEKLHPSVLVEPGSSYFLPHIANVCVEGQESETLILRLDKAGFAVSGGSACSSHSLEPSHVLRAIGLPEKLAFGSLRLSFGFATSENDIESFLKAFRAVLKGL
ncbi:MAG: aminotransferase class V-fold PLP-dependent enzyme, partial [Eggerthellaceae bacterium]|nr:aminotransferase class V-fold PLP-dependent enzyme [Eggerthellaceae bacterium]